jgi:hypothetical protein
MACLFLAGAAVTTPKIKAIPNYPLNMTPRPEAVRHLDLPGFSAAAPTRLIRLLFIHHSCGGQLLAAPGPIQGNNTIYKTHPNGGGLRVCLESNSYSVHEASYGSRIGNNTDLFDWLPKFRTQMDQILACDFQDKTYTEDTRNNIVVFKSCFPNNNFKAEGTPPGDPNGPDLTLWNAKAAYAMLLDEFRNYPEVLFVYVTAPPLAPKRPPQSLWKQLAKKVLRREPSLAQSAVLARQFNNWLSGTGGWLKDADLNHVVVFDYYDILTDCGASDLSAFSTNGGFDSHPNSEGNQKATEAFVRFLNQAVHRAGLRS